MVCKESRRSGESNQRCRAWVEALEGRCLLSVHTLANLNAQPLPTAPHDFADVNGTLFFSAGSYLWKSDGTAAGTVPVKSFDAMYGATDLVNVDGTLYFIVNRHELWKSDGTFGGTVLVKSIPGTSNSMETILRLTACNGELFFAADDGTHGMELWKSNGTAAGTLIVRDINPGPGAGCLAEDSDSPDKPGLTPLGEAVYFTGDDGVHGLELWRSDGTAGGTSLVKDIAPGPASGLRLPGYVSGMVVVDDELFFAASDGVHGQELWKTNGTAAGTVMVKDTPGPAANSLFLLTASSDQVFYYGPRKPGSYYELWRSNGTSAGTSSIPGVEVRIDYPGQSMVAVGSELFFAGHAAGDTNSPADELWKTDGTAAGTARVKRSDPGQPPLAPRYLMASGGLLFFIAVGNGDIAGKLWRSDGTSEGTYVIWDENVIATNWATALTPWRDGVVFNGGLPQWVNDAIPPSADIGGPYTVDEGSSLALSGIGSPVAGATITSYEWDWNYDGASFSVDATGPNPVFSAATIDGPAIRTVALRVLDSNYETSPVVTTTVTITNVAPTAVFTSPVVVARGQSGSVKFSGQADKSPSDITAGFKYSYDFNGDGTFEIADSASATAVVPAGYLAVGTNTIRGRIADKDGGFNDYVTQVVVRARPVAIPGGPYSVGEGSSLNLGGSATVGNGQTVAAYEWDLDYDGANFSVDASGASPTFSAAGIDGPASRTVALRVRDDAEIVSDIGAATVQITNAPPTATFSSSGFAAFGQDGVVIFSNPGDASVADVAGGFRYSFDFDNDGTFEIANSANPRATVPAGFLQIGANTIVGRIIDKDGGYRDYPANITVIDTRPTASAGGPYGVNEGSSIVLSGGGSAYAGRTIAGYEWDLDYDGANFTIDATGATPTFSAGNIDGPATRTVGLRVRDDTGQTRQISAAVVNIANVAPTAHITGAPAGAIPGATINLSSAVADPGPADKVTLLWHVQASNGQQIADAAASGFSFVPSAEGTYTVTLTATDQAGAAAHDTAVISVAAQRFALGGTVYNDANGDGIRAASDKPLPGVLVYLDLDQDAVQDSNEPASVTNAAGQYLFGDVLAGNYAVRAAAAAGWRTSSAGGLSAPNLTTAEIALTQTALITGKIFFDRNGNRRMEATEGGLSRVRVFADLDKDGVWDRKEPSVLTDILGNYALALPAGKYSIRMAPTKKYSAVTTPKAKAYRIVAQRGQVAPGRNFGARKR